MHHQNNSSFSMLFSMPNQYRPYDQYYHQEVIPSSVDCTLSLGTPSTRLTESDAVPGDGERRGRHERRSGSCVTNFCWDLLQPKNHHHAAAPAANHQKNGSRGGSNNGGNNGGGANNIDPLLARRCANCDTTSTPLWRNGPRGPKSLCNACGIRFKKEERRATAAAAHGGGSAVVGMDPNNNNNHMYSHHNNSWIPHAQTQKLPCYSPNEFRFMEDDTAHHENDTNGIPFLSWRLNVTDRPGLVHDFTR